MANNWLYLQYHKHPTVIGTEVHSFFRTEAFTDLIIFCDGGQVKAHQLVLASVSPFLKMIFHQRKFSDKVTIHLPDVPLDDMTALIHFLYGGEVLVPLRQLGNLQDLTKFLQMDKSVQNFRVEVPDSNSEQVRVRLSDSSPSSSDLNVDSDFVEVKSKSKIDNISKTDDQKENEDTNNKDTESLEFKKEPTENQEFTDQNSISAYSDGNCNANETADVYDDHFTDENNADQLETSNEENEPILDDEEIDDTEAVDMSQPSLRQNQETTGALNCSIRNPKRSPSHQNNGSIHVPQTRSGRGLRGGTLKHLLTHQTRYTAKSAASSFRVPVTMLQSHRSGVLQLQCNLCKYECSSYEDFRKHEKLHRPAFTCEFCGKGFFIKWNLVAHLRTHTGEKPFLCNFCQQPFRQKAHLIKHISAVHGHKEEKSVANLGPIASYLCSFCGVAFEDKEQVRKHISQEHRDLLKRAY